ncbi:phosphoribosyltransferase [Nocardia brasiliensis]|uniref:phosphoribosyltransferase n=1 Tax=Nocardia brasiliensis TaxID=37326 RepID=UPI002455A612|nr:phosphoribosyltransferase [Nocardia brasiliensis]
MDMIYEPDKAISDAKTVLKDIRFDTLVGTGLSGALMIPTLARALSVDFLLIRKPNDGSHARSKCEGRLGEKWLFVDDLIETGETLRRVYHEVGEAATARGHATRFIGAYLYESTRYRDSDACYGRWLHRIGPAIPNSAERRCHCSLCA